MQRYNLIWRFLLRLADINNKITNLRPIRLVSPRIWELKRVVNALQTYICSDVIESLMKEKFDKSSLKNQDFETLVESHRQFLLVAVQQSFLLSSTLFSIFTNMLDTIDTFCENSEMEDHVESYESFKEYLSVLFALLKRRGETYQANKTNEIKFLQKFLLRLDYNNFFKSLLTK